MVEIFKVVGQVAGTRTNVVILGESGTGKELVAREVHRLGGDPKRPFVAINSAAIPETLIESVARQQGPLVVVCEDLHWADPTSLELLEQLLALTDRAP